MNELDIITEKEESHGMSGGIKHDGGKLRYDLVPSFIIDGLVAVYMFGVRKYADDNWMGGISVRRLFSALMRHSWEWLRGKDYDDESGIHHMFHAMWNCGAIVWMCTFKPEMDNRRKSYPDYAKTKGNA